MAQSESSEGGHLDAALIVSMALQCNSLIYYCCAKWCQNKWHSMTYSLHFPTVNTVSFWQKKTKHTINKVRSIFGSFIIFSDEYLFCQSFWLDSIENLHLERKLCYNCSCSPIRPWVPECSIMKDFCMKFKKLHV